MKNRILILSIMALLAAGTLPAQQISTLYFLENAPMRHRINPAFQPVSNIYVGITPLSYTYFSVGNNALTMKDLIYKKNGQYVTALYPGESSRLEKRLKRGLGFFADMDLNLLNFGFRLKDYGYVHFAVTERLQNAEVLPSDLHKLLYTDNPATEGRTINLKDLSSTTSLYTEIAAGYSHKINDQWTVGGKLKFLLGTAYAELKMTDATIGMYPDRLSANINGHLRASLPIFKNLPDLMKYEQLQSIGDYIGIDNLGSLLKPSGIGLAFDVGATYKPLPMLQISVSATDLGFIHWNDNADYSFHADSVYTGPTIMFSDIELVENREQTDIARLVSDTLVTFFSDLAQKQLHGTRNSGNGFTRALHGQLHIAADANFLDNKIGVGLYSCTTFRGKKVYEEITLGASVRPVNWFNFALSYSFVNGKWSSLGAGLSIMTYDGINLTLMSDYVPMRYATLATSGGQNITVPSSTKQFNLALGITIVVGTNPKKAKGAKQENDQLQEKPENAPEQATEDNKEEKQDETPAA